MDLLRRGLLTLLMVGTAAPAYADATLFLGSSSNPSNRPARGVALGVSLFVVGFEVEYASTAEETNDAAPALRTGMANVFVQTPVAIAGLRPYLTGGAGAYHERLGADTETNVAMNTGGGVKISLVGPIRARVDYRVLKLSGNPRYSRSTRLYVGLNVSF